MQVIDKAISSITPWSKSIFEAIAGCKELETLQDFLGEESKSIFEAIAGCKTIQSTPSPGSDQSKSSFEAIAGCKRTWRYRPDKWRFVEIDF